MGIALACIIGLIVLGVVYITTDKKIKKQQGMPSLRNPLPPPPRKKKLLIKKTVNK